MNIEWILVKHIQNLGDLGEPRLKLLSRSSIWRGEVLVPGLGWAAKPPKATDENLRHGESERPQPRDFDEHRIQQYSYRFIHIQQHIQIFNISTYSAYPTQPPKTTSGALEYFAKGIHIGKVLVAVEDGVPVLPSRPQVIGPAGDTCHRRINSLCDINGDVETKWRQTDQLV